MKNKKGFTLIEMLIVITIIAVLASLILVGMGGARARSRDSRRIADLHNVMNALELYYSLNGTYPIRTSNSASAWDEFAGDLISADIGVSRIPKDPLNTGRYYYRYGANDLGTDYVLGASLEQDNVALEDDIDLLQYGIDCNDTNYIYCIMP